MGRGSQVVIQICTLRFKDGRTVTARIEAGSRHDECDVLYAGAVDRLPILFQRADSVLLRALFQSFARELRTTFREEFIGTWVPVGGDAENESGSTQES